MLLQLALNCKAPAALVFHQHEDILTLGALVAEHIFETAIPVFSLNQTDYQSMTHAGSARFARDEIVTDDLKIPIDSLPLDQLVRRDQDLQIRNGAEGPAMAIAMNIICQIAVVQGSQSLRDVTRGHIDGCILAHPANLVFAKKMAAATSDGTAEQLAQAGIRVIPDVCWCSITEPLFPPAARVLMINAGKYAHYANGVCGRKVRFGSLRDCVEAAVTGAAKPHPPQWAQGVTPGNEATSG